MIYNRLDYNRKLKKLRKKINNFNKRKSKKLLELYFVLYRWNEKRLIEYED
jgi:uncharacterized membrane protein (DUF485 family)